MATMALPDVLKKQIKNKTRIKEHVPKCVREHIKNQSKTISIATLNAMNRSSIAEHLIKNLICGKGVIMIKDSKY